MPGITSIYLYPHSGWQLNEGRVERHLKGFRVFITYGKSTEIDRKELIDESRMLETMEENYRERNNSLLKMTLVTCFFLFYILNL